MTCNNENFRKAYDADPYGKSTKGCEVHQFCKLFKHLCSINSLIYTKEYDYLTNLKLQKQKL